MRDQEHRLALASQILHGLDQRGLAHVVQIGVRFVEDDDAGVTVHGARQPDALALPAGKQAAGFAHCGVVAAREVQDHVMHPGTCGGLDYLVRVDRPEAGDILGDGPVEQLDILRQIAQMRPQLVPVPALNRLAVDQHLAFDVRPNPHQRARQRRFSGAGRPDHRHHLARREIRRQPLQNRQFASRRGCRQILDAHMPLRHRVDHPGSSLRMLGQQGFQPGKGSARRKEGLPGRNHQIDRLKGARHQHVGGDHGAHRQLAVDHQQRARPQRQRLLGVPQELGRRLDAVPHILHLGIQGQMVLVAHHPAAAQVAQHPQRLDHLGVAQLAVHIGIRLHPGFGTLLDGPVSQAVAQKGHPDHQRGKNQRQRPQHGMQQIQHHHVDGYPRRIHESKQAVAGEELAHVGQVGKRLHRVVFELIEVSLEAGVEDTRIELLVQPHPGPHQQARARPLGKAHHGEQKQHDQGNRHQRQFVLAHHHPVEDLQHVDGRGQHQDVHHHAENHRDGELAPERPECRRQFAALEKGRFFHIPELID